MKIGFIGIGNMGSAMLKGALKVLGPETLLFTDVNSDLMARIYQETGVGYVNSNEELVGEVDIIVLAVKPQYLGAVFADIYDRVKSHQIILSIAPGITIDHIKDQIEANVRVVRSMPNTPALVQEGMTAYTYSLDTFTTEDKLFIERFFQSFGKCVLVEEHQLDMVVPVSGSAPAYMFMMLEAMGDAGVLAGLPRSTAYELAAQTMLGAAKMVLETKTHPGELKDAVCSPGGTTIEAVRVLEQKGFRSAIIEAMESCYIKTKSFK